MYRIRRILYFPLLIPAILCYLFLMKRDRKRLLRQDIHRYAEICDAKDIDHYFVYWYKYMVKLPEFRNVYYLRLGKIKHLINFILPGRTNLYIPDNHGNVPIGGGLFIQHGWSTIIGTDAIGDNLWVSQNVTIGHRDSTGHPTIGNNVTIGSGAVVLGPITIGDNVNIGANAIVIKDVPSNTTVVSSSSHICRCNGEKVYEQL